MEYSSVSLADLLSWDAEKRLVLPNFQREFVWERDAQRRLAASFIVDIPIGSILIVDGVKDDFAARRLGEQEGKSEPTPECRYLLDGQQRISCLKSVFGDFFSEYAGWKSAWNALYPKLRNRWMMRIAPGEGERDIFGWANLNFRGFDRVDPDEVYERLQCERILKGRGKRDYWHHPTYLHANEPEPIGTEEEKQKIGQLAAQHGLIPLWQLFDPGDEGERVHQYALTSLAYDRMEELRAQASASEDRLQELLEPVEPSIGSGQSDIRKQEQAWHKLATRWAERVTAALEGVCENEIPTTELPTDEIKRAVAIFENINKGGTPLSVFDLVVARAALSATEKVSLRERITAKLEEIIQVPDVVTAGLMAEPPHELDCRTLGVLKDKSPVSRVRNQFLNLLSVVSHYEYGQLRELRVDDIKRDRILQLDPEQINTNAFRVAEALMRAFAFFHLRCGITRLSDISYELMILPVSYVLLNDGFWKDAATINKLEFWYWSSLFGGVYRDSKNQQCIDDIVELHRWVDGGDNPFSSRKERVLNSPEYSDESTLKMEDPKEHPTPSAIHDGILHYILSTQPQDLLPTEKYPEKPRISSWRVASEWEIANADGETDRLELNDHHIMPLAASTKLGESSAKLRNNQNHILNSVLNRTYVSSTSNRLIRSRSPKSYFEFIDDLAIGDHCIPSSLADYFPSGDSVEKESYKRMLEERYRLLRHRITSELSQLIGG